MPRTDTATPSDATTGTVDAWRPDRYGRFADERAQPFHDLLALVDPVPGGRVVDLGCGPGELTVDLHRRTAASRTVGVDRSPAMLERARAHAGEGVSFAEADLRAVGPAATDPGLAGPFDVVFSNATLHWVPDHTAVLAGTAAALAPGGQLAVQVPDNRAHPSHALIGEVLHEPAWADLAGRLAPDPADAVLPAVRYAEVLDALGFEEIAVRRQVYLHHLPSTADVVAWTRGTTLTRVEAAVDDPERFERFVHRYRERLLEELGGQAPYLYTFERILFRARRPR